MSQDIFTTIDPLETDGTELADILVKFKDAYVSCNLGPSRPTELKTGGLWVDFSTVGKFILKMYNGTDDIPLIMADIGLMSYTEKISISDIVELIGNSKVSGNLEITGDLTVLGTTTTFNAENLEVVDANITVNKGGNQATANISKSGFTVEMSDATNAVLGYDSTKTSKFVVGEVGSEQEIVTTGHSQTLSNKTLLSPVFTGTPTAPTAPSNTNNTQLATTAFVKSVVNSGKGKITLDNNFLSEIPLIGEDISVARCFKVSYHIYRKTSDGYKTLTGVVVMEAIPDGVDKWVIYEPLRSEGLGESGISFVPVVKTATRTNLGIQLDNMPGTGHSCTFYYNIEMFEA